MSRSCFFLKEDCDLEFLIEKYSSDHGKRIQETGPEEQLFALSLPKNIAIATPAEEESRPEKRPRGKR